MFVEPVMPGQRSGWIEVICGPMFSGKTEELIRRVRRAQIAGQRVLICKPKRDTRYSESEVVSHDRKAVESIAVEDAREILKHSEPVQVVAIDEVQFFDYEIVEVCRHLALKGKRVIVAGLDMDYRARPFGPVPYLLAVAEYITKLHAICKHCGALATHSYRLTDEREDIVLGAEERYEPRCRICFHMGNILDFGKREEQ